MESILILGLLLTMIFTILGALLLNHDIGVLGIISFVVAVLCGIGTLAIKDAITKRREEFCESFENGSYTVNVEKCFEVYDDDTEKELQKLLIVLSNAEDKTMQIQKCCDEHFVSTVEDTHYVLSNDIIRDLIEQGAITHTS